MKIHKLTLVSSMALILASHYAHAQGCSDAGFCTIDSFKPHEMDSIKIENKQIKIGAFVGKADRNILVYGSYLEYNHQINTSLGFDAKLSSLAQQGNGLVVYDFSDILLNANYQASQNLKFTLGAKLPLTQANKSQTELSLPMDYQASLGTVDLVLGMAYGINKIQLVAAIQQPITQNNNQFVSTLHAENSTLSGFQSTRKFQRSGDVLLRVSYPFQLNQKLKLTPSLLPIYHLKNDKYTDETNIQREIQGSQGLTLNANAYFDYELSKQHAIQLNLGMPLLVRKNRPDGLTRSVIANIEYRMRF